MTSRRPHKERVPVAKLPFGPLEGILAQRWDGGRAEDYRKREFCVAAMAEQLRSDRQMIYRWQRGGIPWHTADRLAIMIGLHPCEVWETAWWELYSSEEILHEVL